MNKENLKDIYPLSPLQEGMLFHALFEDNQSAYVEQFSYRISNGLNVENFRLAWQELVDRHDILRTAFEYDKTKQPIQIVLKEVKVTIPCIDLSLKDTKEQEDELEKLRAQERKLKFSEGAGKLARFLIIKLSDQNFEIIRTHHHILLDGWSSAILLQELVELYQAKQDNHPPMLGDCISSKAYYRWLGDQQREDSLTFWKDYIGDCQPTRLPFTPPEIKNQPYKAAKHHLDLGAFQTERLNSLAKDLHVTPAIFCQAIWGILLGRYNDTKDVLFCTIATHRPPHIPAIERMVGLFINAVPVCFNIRNDKSFANLLTEIQKSVLESDDHRYLALNDILHADQLPDHLFAFENFHVDGGFQDSMDGDASALKIARTLRHEHTHYDFTIAIDPSDTLRIEFSYNCTRFEDAEIRRIASHFETALNSVLDNPSIELGDIDILPPSEKRILRQGFNHPIKLPPKSANIVKLFKKQLSLSPTAPAVWEREKVTKFAELDQQSDQIAAYLQERYHLRKGQAVGVVLARSSDLVSAMIGILKAGGVYVPIDPDFPKDRINFMLTDSHAICALTSADLQDKITPQFDVVTISAILQTRFISPKRVSLTANDLAYMSYTSGSTGTPKGVMIEHGGLVNLIKWHQKQFSLETGSRATLFASPSFDASVWEILPNLLSGLCLYPLNGSVRLDVDELIDFLEQHEISHSFVPPSICEEICLHHKGRLSHKIKLLSGGDSLKTIHNGDIEVFNNYGPTECSVVATSTRVNDSHTNERPSIGFPIDNIQVHILDSDRRLMPIGTVGEIYLGGAGLSRGYFNRDDLNLERFSISRRLDNLRLYRTGDLACWTAQGMLAYQGRNDDQIQLRGYRVEPGEIEARISCHDGVEKVAILTPENVRGEPDIIAFCKLKSGYDETSLKTDLTKSLPHYMVPSRIIVQDDFPYTERGKLDKRALLAGLDQQPQKTRNFTAQTPTQSLLQEIWQEVMDCGAVAIDDDFFAIGGHSLSATRIMSRLRNKLGRDLPFDSLFNNPSINELARFIDENTQTPSAERDHNAPTITRSKRRQAAS